MRCFLLFFFFFPCWCCPRKKEKSEVFHQTGVTKVVDVEEKVGRRPLKTCRAAVATGGGGGGACQSQSKARNSICFVSREVSGGVGGLKVFFKMALEAQALEKKKEREIERGGWGGREVGRGECKKIKGERGREGRARAFEVGCPWRDLRYTLAALACRTPFFFLFACVCAHGGNVETESY